MTGEKALNVLVDIQQELEKFGEERLAIIEYATEQELVAEDHQGGSRQDEDDA